MAPRISVLMSAYNAEATIALCLESLQAQTYTNWEAIVVNDGSHDKTGHILNQIALTDSRIKVLHLATNVGLAAALNIALNHASGEYLARQDADDLSHPERFSEQLAYLEANPTVAILGTAMELIDDHGDAWGTIVMPEEPTIRDWIKGPAVAHATIMGRPEAIRSVGGYNPQYRRGQDYDLWLRILARGHTIRSLKLPLYSYRVSRSDFRKRKALGSRLQEMKIRYTGFRRLRLSLWAYPYVLKPIISGLVPANIKAILHGRRFGP